MGEKLHDKLALSVVMSVFNGERFLAPAIESILNQSFTDFEFILIDDGSTDGTASIIEDYRKQDTRIRFFKQANLGLIESLNKGCGLANGRYIARMDADDVALQDRFQRQIEFLENNPLVGVLGGAVEFISVQGKPISISRNPTGDAEIRSAFAHESPFWHPTVMMRKEAFQTVGGYRKAFIEAEDYDFWLRIAEHFEIANLDAVLVQYRLHPHQVSVLHRKRQILSSLAARACAMERSKGNPDPLDGAESITEAVLSKLGVSESAQQGALLDNYVWTIRNMCNTGEYKVAAGLLDQIQLGQRQDSFGARAAADLYLLAARIYWHEKNFRKASLNLVRALRLRPMIAARPLKHFVRWTSRASLPFARRHTVG